MEAGRNNDVLGDDSKRPADFLLRAYKEHKEGLFAYIVSFVGDHAAAEDILHEIFAKLLKEPEAYSGRGGISGFLYVCARNNAFNWLKRQNKQVQYSEELDGLIDFSGKEPGNSTELKELKKLVNRALFDIPVKQREIIMLKIYKDMKFREIAEITGDPINTVIARYQYGLRKLQELLREYQNGS
ncbi:MAG: sigma-70 family RNA polymerase sigma factor [Elusimicrobia bacterium]|nr:sigma-70 family RNA polymerase sigma factor [Elusimicrobiota bacterium]